MTNIVYIATSLDGYIADKDNGLDWLNCVPNPHQDDMGFVDFMNSIDALVMGRNTFETVCGFDVPWPYNKPVFVLSNTLKSVPEKALGKAELISGSLSDVVAALKEKGHERLYIDGGKVVQSFMAEDMIDELIISRIPVVLGGGIPLFGSLPELQMFQHISTDVKVGAIVQSHYHRQR